MTQSLHQGKRFFCREWTFAKIVHCLDNRSASKTCGALIMGGPGCGKTALCCEIVWPTMKHGKQQHLSQRVLSYHFCQAHDTDTISLSGFILSLVEQMCVSDHISGYSEKLKDPEIQAVLNATECERNPDEVFKKAVLFPLLEIEPPNQAYFILVDSIDESFFQPVGEKSSTSRTIAELLANHHHLFPQWLLLVCSARKQGRSVTRLFTGFRKISLDDLRKSHVVRDVQQYILSRLDEEEHLRQHLSRETAEMLNQLHIKSNGCFMYLEKVLDGVSENFIMLREIREIPGTLNGLYLWLCQRLFVRKQFSKVQPLLNVILATRKPLTEEELFQCAWTRNTQLTWEEFQKRLALLEKLLIEDKNGTKILFHHSFAEWLLDVKHCTQKYLCHASEGHAMLAMKYTCFPRHLSPSELHDFVFHLLKIPQCSTLQSYHLPLWLLTSGAPIDHAFSQTLPKDSRVTKLLVEAGAKLPADDIDENRSDAVGLKSPDDPLELLLQTGGSINQLDHNQRTLLHSAAYEGDDHLVARLIARGADLEAVDKNGQTPLNLAARQGHSQVVELLLNGGSDPDHADNEGWTPLRSSAWAGHTDVVISLLNKGADVDLEDADHRTALRAAAWGGHEEIVLRLLQYKANVNKVDNEGRTALIAAAYMGHAEIISHLLDHGAEINHEDTDGRTALSVAALCVPASEGHASVVSLLLERGAQVDHRDKDGMTPLLVAAFEGHSEVCELLLEGDADVDNTDNSGRTPLFAAASMGHPAVVNLLLFWGAAIDFIDPEGRTVLSIAAAQGNTDVVRQLLDRGLDEMHRDNGGWTPLHYAAFEGHVDVCQQLIEAGARVTEVDNDGRVPLILAAQEGHSSLVSKLLDVSRNMIDVKSHDGKTALRVAALEGHRDTVHMLLSRGSDLNYKDADGRSTLYLLALENRLDMAMLFLTNGADVEATDLEGRSPLHVSAWQGHYEMVEALLNYGANVNAVDNDRRTALQSAAWQGHSTIVRLLLERQADIDHTCNQGATALCIAAQEGHDTVVRLLLEHGANSNHADQFGRNPLRVALKGGHSHVVRILEEHIAHHGPSSHRQCSTSTTSLTSASTAETKPCSAILCQPGILESPESTVDKRRSFISNQSSSKSSSNLTSSTNKSSHQAVDIRSVWTPPVLTFTQQLQQCTRNRNRVSRVLSPLSEPQSPVPSPPQSPLSDVQGQRVSPVQMTSLQDANVPSTAHVPVLINPLVEETVGSTRLPSSGVPILGSAQPVAAFRRPAEPRVRRNGIVTNPNYKSGHIGKSATNPSQLRVKHISDRGLPVKKETPL
ncbi:ankyrin repeat domain-containing protein 50-like [Limulus polyphemus]|uniref:Ankyrin repeat domain-containing protein 50-like n=1 Tax=Limulus polyphemus TaxID=6850 RepID=A0ABM1BN39_LIMPO|nr:ankyrin repeat domain-containing protein 50-like [Limulus polyphemus]XP_022253592.1 ankyrin repeat domain-containing protein 50-like [Limulus polyphemus]XP_022253593.1 ankyrin repeat domain-containing protein 50-like [Limulus polyphemus]